jgi:hypothetical protein
MQLNFSGLYHKSALDPAANNGAIFKVPGVYIWGFVFYKNENGIGDPVDFTKEKAIANPDEHVFIPYYVGESSSSISKRLFEHIQPRESPSSKRTRLTIDYIKVFFNDPEFPINSGSYLSRKNDKGMSVNAFRFFSWIDSNQIGNDKLQYFNNEFIMQLLYPSNNKLSSYGSYSNNNFPITHPAININDTIDSRSDLINYKSNFFFTFISIPPPINVKEIEAFTVLMLKGKTLGEFTQARKCIRQMNAGNFHNIIDNTQFNIFKQPNSIRSKPNIPIELDNIAFPGYL